MANGIVAIVAAATVAAVGLVVVSAVRYRAPIVTCNFPARTSLRPIASVKNIREPLCQMKVENGSIVHHQEVSVQTNICCVKHIKILTHADCGASVSLHTVRVRSENGVRGLNIVP